jgi:hypothetical protein
MIHEQFREKEVIWTIRKFNKQHDLIGTSEFRNNVMLNTGINQVWNLITGATSGTLFNTANSYLCVGSDSTAAGATQTGPQSADTTTARYYHAMDTGYPLAAASQTMVWRATFDTNQANFKWSEFLVANGNTSTAIHLNRKVSDQGTKVSGQQWELTLSISLS